MLTTAQLATLKAAILADPVLSLIATGPNTDRAAIAAALSAEATPAWYVWRTSYSPAEIKSAMTVNVGTAQLDGLTAGKRDALLWFISDTINPSDPAVVASLDDFCGSQNTLKTSLINGAKRKARLCEKLLATGTGSLVAPGTLTYEGGISIDDIAKMFDA